MLKMLLVPVVVLAFLAAGCGETRGYVTGKKFEPTHTEIQFAGCGFHFDGSGYGCSAGKPILVTVTDRYRVFTTNGAVTVNRVTYDGCRVGDWFQNGHCWEAKP